MKIRKHLIIGCAATLVLAGLLLASYFLLAPASLRMFVSDMASVAYTKLFVDIPRGEDVHRFYVNSGYTSPNAYIAHGGGINRFVYNNSVEAAQDSIAQGFRFIEFDLLITSDGYLVGGHSWEEIRKMAHLPVEEKPLSLEDVAKISRPGEFSPVTAKDICRMLEENPDLMVVTDKVEDYELLLREIPYPGRLIVEVFGSLSGYEKAIKAGVRYPSLSVYGRRQIQLARDCRIPIISLNDDHFFNSPEGIKLVKEMHDMGITILLFNFQGDAYWDTAEFVREHLGCSFSMIYTNSWSPAHLPEPPSSSAASQMPNSLDIQQK